MIDRELLELAAKAAGVPLHQLVNRYDCWEETPILIGRAWSPLTDDGDALRLAVKLGLLLMPYPLDNAIRVTRLDQPNTIVSFGTPPEPYAATRRAIVCAAAEIGKTMP